jgi:hypothetical protein
MILTAISPRLAMRIFENMQAPDPMGSGPLHPARLQRPTTHREPGRRGVSGGGRTLRSMKHAVPMSRAPDAAPERRLRFARRSSPELCQ